jgi:hypothetical protein
MQRIHGFLLILSIPLVAFSGCILLQKPYVGRMIDSSGWPKLVLEKKIVIQTNAADFELTITRMDDGETYVVEGTMDGSNGSLKSIDHMIVQDCSFSLILTKDNRIVDNVSFFPLGTDHTRKLPFKRTFKTVPFDSVQISYQIAVGDRTSYWKDTRCFTGFAIDEEKN